MQNRWRWLLIGVLVLGVLAEYLGLSAKLGARIVSLASQPSVSTTFQDPESGRTDALTTLIAFAILAPMAAGVAVVGLILVSKAFEAVVVSCRLPGWVSAPVVGTVTIVAIYVTTHSWMPASLHALGLVARAYLVYAYGTAPVIR
jgi:hypothetical protein